MGNLMGDTPADFTLKTRQRDVIERYGGKRGAHLLATVAAAEFAIPLIKRGWAHIHRRESYTITVTGTDDIYPDLHEWVLERIPQVDRKAMIASTGENFGHFPTHFPTVETAEPPPVRLRYDGSRVQTVEIEGHKVAVSVSREEYPGGRDKIPENWRRAIEKVTFYTTSPEARDAVVRMIQELLRLKHGKVGPPPLLMPNRWGGSWNKRDDLAPRTPDSVVLKDGQYDCLVNDFSKFLEAEASYQRLSQPWHRGYLFHGDPGTGKTSIARALAHQFEIPIYYLPLADLEHDADLIGLVGDIKPRSMLLIEDVDVYHAAKDRDDEEGSTTLATMLNALDGVFTPHGLITVLTSNHKDKLDDALLRPGRIDVDMEFTALDKPQAERLYEWCTGESPNGLCEQYVGRSPAELINAIRISKEAAC